MVPGLVYPDFRRMCHWTGKRVAFSVYYRTVRRSYVCADLFMLPGASWAPIMVMEFSVGRAAGSGIALAFDRLEPKGTKWHWYKYFGIAGNLPAHDVLYDYRRMAAFIFVKMAAGNFQGMNSEQISGEFSKLMGQPGTDDDMYGDCCYSVFWIL